MTTKSYRKYLTDTEWNAISTLTMHTKLDTCFDVCRTRNGDDAFKDFEEDKIISLHEGLELLYEGLAYPLVHERLEKNEIDAIVSLFKEFDIGDADGYAWLSGPDID